MNPKPEKIGPYELKEEIGRGGMSVVYRAYDTLNDRYIALKVLPPELAFNEIYLDRFTREGQNGLKMRHPNVVRVYESGNSDSYNYIALELGTNGTLTERLNPGQAAFSFAETIDILSQVAAGLDYAHRNRFLHRDLKPSNILFTEDTAKDSTGKDSGTQRRVFVADFGVAKDLSGDQTQMTIPGYSVGTPAYMSPEQARGDQNLDARSDIYSLGVIAYQMFTGYRPIESDSSVSHLVLLRRIIDEPPRLPEVANAKLPSGIVHELKKVLSKSPSHRHQTATEFANALQAGMTWVPTQTESQALDDVTMMWVPTDFGIESDADSTAFPGANVQPGYGHVRATDGNTPVPPAYAPSLPDPPPSYASQQPQGRNYGPIAVLLGLIAVVIASFALLRPSFGPNLLFQTEGVPTSEAVVVGNETSNESGGDVGNASSDDGAPLAEAEESISDTDSPPTLAPLPTADATRESITATNSVSNTALNVREVAAAKPLTGTEILTDIPSQAGEASAALLSDDITNTVGISATAVSASSASQPSVDNSPTGNPTEFPTQTATAIAIESNTATNTPTEAPPERETATATPTETPEPTDTSTSIPTATSTNRPTHTPTPTEVPTETATNIPTPTGTPTKTSTATPTPDLTATEEALQVRIEQTLTAIASAIPPTPTATNMEVTATAIRVAGRGELEIISTPTKKSASTNISTDEPTDVATPEPTSAPTSTVEPTSTPKPTATQTNTDTPTPIPTREPTSTPVPTLTPTNTSVPTNTNTPRHTSTPIPTQTPTHTPTRIAPIGRFRSESGTFTVFLPRDWQSTRQGDREIFISVDESSQFFVQPINSAVEATDDSADKVLESFVSDGRLPVFNLEPVGATEETLVGDISGTVQNYTATSLGTPVSVRLMAINEPGRAYVLGSIVRLEQMSAADGWLESAFDLFDPGDPPTPTNTPTRTKTPTSTSTRTPTFTATQHPTETPLPTDIATATAPPTPTSVLTFTPTAVDTSTPTSTPTAVPATATEVPVAPKPPGLITDFEAFGNWRIGDQQYATFTRSQEQVHGGNFSGKLAYNFPSVQANYVIFQRTIPIVGQTDRLTMWVHSSGAQHFLNAWVTDATGRGFQFTFGQITHSGWKQMTALLDLNQGWPVEAQDGQPATALQFPISVTALVVDGFPDEQASQGVIYMDDLIAGPETGGQPAPPAPAPTQPSSGEQPVQPTSPAPPAGPLSGKIAYTKMNINSNKYDTYIYQLSSS